MNIKSLQLFIHVCGSKSFTKTANAMHISPSALSRQIQKLEDELEQRLLIRDNRSVELTDAGKKLLPVANSINLQWSQFRHSIQGTQQHLSGQLRLFCSVTASFSHLPELLSDFRLAYPHIELKLSTGDPAQAIDKILSDEADIVITAMPSQLPAKLEFETIGQIPLSVIAPLQPCSFSHKLQQEKSNWHDIPFIIPEAGTARERSNTWFKDMKIKPNIYAQVAGHEGVISMVALGMGVGIVPDVVINNSPVKDKIQRLNVAPIKPFKLGICCQKSQLDNPLINALWSVAKDKFIHA